MRNDTDKDTPFNFAMLYYMGLNELLAQKETAAVEGNLGGYFEALKQINLRISFKLTKPEKKEINDNLLKAKNLIRAVMPRSQRAAMQFAALVNDELGNVLEVIDTSLWAVMNKYKMIFPSIKLESGGLTGLRKRLNLTGDKK